MIVDVAVADGFCIGNPSLAKVSPAHDFSPELGANTTSKLCHILFTCLKFSVTCQASHRLAVFVHVSLTYSERGIRHLPLLCLWGRRSSRSLHPDQLQAFDLHVSCVRGCCFYSASVTRVN